MTVLWAKKDTREEIRAWEIFCSDLLSGMSMVSRCMPVTESMRRPMQGALWVWPSQCGGTIRAWWVGGRVWADPPTLPSWAYSIHRIAFQLDLYWLFQKGWCPRRLYWPFLYQQLWTFWNLHFPHCTLGPNKVFFPSFPSLTGKSGTDNTYFIRT